MYFFCLFFYRSLNQKFDLQVHSSSIDLLSGLIAFKIVPYSLLPSQRFFWFIRRLDVVDSSSPIWLLSWSQSLSILIFSFIRICHI